MKFILEKKYYLLLILIFAFGVFKIIKQGEHILILLLFELLFILFLFFALNKLKIEIEKKKQKK